MKTDKPEVIEEIFGEVQMLKRRCQPKDEYAFVCSVSTESEIAQKADKLLNSGATILSQINILDY